MISDGIKAIARRLKATDGHFYPIADGFNPIAGGFYPIADGLNLIADGFYPIADGKKATDARIKVISRRVYGRASRHPRESGFAARCRSVHPEGDPSTVLRR